MPYTIDLHIKNINDSLQVGDTVYYTTSNIFGGFNVNGGDWQDIVKIGTCTLINKPLNRIRVEGDLNIDLPGVNSYIFFSKDNLINLSSAKGYFAEVKMINDEYNKKSELFQITLGADTSSK